MANWHRWRAPCLVSFSHYHLSLHSLPLSVCPPLSLSSMQVSGLKEVIVSKARSVGRQTSFNRQSGRPVAWGFWLANALVSPDRIRLTYSDCYYIVFIFSICPYMNIFRFVFKGLREKMGLERCRLCVSPASTSYLCIHVSWSRVPFNAAPVFYPV